MGLLMILLQLDLVKYQLNDAYVGLGEYKFRGW
jgi:hypothetical protein